MNDLSEEFKQIRTLFLTNFPPYPPIGGAPLRNWQNINILMNYGSVAVFSVSRANGDSYTSEYPPGVSIWNHHYFEDINVQNPGLLRKMRWLLHPRKHFLTHFRYKEAIREELDQVLEGFKPDLIIFEELWLYPYLTAFKCQEFQIILDNHNVEAPLFIEQQSTSKDLREKIRSSITFNKIKAIEHDFIQRVDQVWSCSDIDTYRFKNLYGDSITSKLKVVPNGLDVNYYDPVRLDDCYSTNSCSEESNTLIFIANFGYLPNQVAAQFLTEKIFPELQKIYPNCRLILAGSSPTSEMLAAAQQNPSIVVAGRVPDTRPFIAQASVVIVPLLQGGGTRLKILEAFAAGRPVVSTTKGAEGLNVKDGKHLLIRDDVEALVEGVSNLWTNPDLRQNLALNAYELVKAEYSWEAIAKIVDQNLQELFSDA
jgi:glycosyltransferase involved in cell wall biosynthesis